MPLRNLDHRPPGRERPDQARQRVMNRAAEQQARVRALLGRVPIRPAPAPLARNPAHEIYVDFEQNWQVLPNPQIIWAPANHAWAGTASTTNYFTIKTTAYPTSSEPMKRLKSDPLHGPEVLAIPLEPRRMDELFRAVVRHRPGLGVDHLRQFWRSGRSGDPYQWFRDGLGYVPEIKEHAQIIYQYLDACRDIDRLLLPMAALYPPPVPVVDNEAVRQAAEKLIRNAGGYARRMMEAPHPRVQEINHNALQRRIRALAAQPAEPLHLEPINFDWDPPDDNF